jgi:dihydrofolate reductase
VAKVFFEISTSLDGFVAGPDPTLEQPLGRDGERLHDWVVALKSWRERHGRTGGETGPESELLEESLRNAGATIMGRRMFSGGHGAWEDDPNADGWWGDDPPFRHAVFVLTNHPRDQVTKQGGTTYTFVNEGIASALEQAQAAAGDKDVAIAGGANTIQQYLSAGLVDEFQIHIAPLLLGGGVRLFDQAPEDLQLERTQVLDSPRATHLKFRVVK